MFFYIVKGLKNETFIYLLYILPIMLLNCKNKKCMYEWNYKGEGPFYATCPRCKSSVKIKRGDTNGTDKNKDDSRNEPSA